MGNLVFRYGHGSGDRRRTWRSVDRITPSMQESDCAELSFGRSNSLTGIWMLLEL